MVNMYYVTTLLIVSNYYPVWASPRLERTKSCLFRGKKLGLGLFRRQLTDRQKLLLEKMPDRSKGPPKSKHYDPTQGYEQYWHGGDWVFDPLEPKKEDMCGTRCHKIMKEYGKVCGRNKDFTHKTFDTYCDMRTADCNGAQMWRIAYRGECKDELRTNPTAAKQIVSRSMDWIAKFSSKYPG